LGNVYVRNPVYPVEKPVESAGDNRRDPLQLPRGAPSRGSGVHREVVHISPGSWG